ncbi:MAG: radical SAM protein [Crenarchaeota archaeon]|nr:radical SAM protein [Thermoproteota archaeon]MDA1124579.1 radical SAM protein [Thermoproteota archaeon]
MLEELVGTSTAIEHAINDEELTFDDGMEILNDDNLHVIGAAADIVRKKLVGDTVSFASSYYMNYTNLCAASCQMCAFYRKGGEDDAYTLTPEQIEKRVTAAKDLGATEVHIVGGFHPDLQLDYYEQMMSAIKQKHPDMTIKAFTAAEIFFLSKLTKNSVTEILSRLKDAGLDSMPGGGAELFHPDVRTKIIRGKCTGQQWLDTIEIAHNLGIKSNVTMLYGHIEKPEHIVDHLIKIRELQKKTNGFITLIPLKFSLDNTELEKKHMVTHESSSIYDLKIIALSRLMLAQTLKNISVYWVAYGTKLAQVALSHGGNDLVGTAFSEEIYRAAGKPTNSSLLELASLAKEIGRIPIQRNTFFETLRTFT